MANEVYNEIRMQGEEETILRVLREVQNDYLGLGSIDFNKLIPVPEELRSGNEAEISAGRVIYRKFQKVNPTVSKEHEEIYISLLSPQERNRFLLGRKAVRLEEKYGVFTYYDWCSKHWGPRMNAEGLVRRAEPDSIRFRTLWKPPHPVMEALARRYPDIRFVHEWADEDIGINCGTRIYRNGRLEEERFPVNRKDAIEFSTRVFQCEPKEYGLYLNATGTRYIQCEDEYYRMVEVGGFQGMLCDRILAEEDVPQGTKCFYLQRDIYGSPQGLEKKPTASTTETVILPEWEKMEEWITQPFTEQTALKIQDEYMTMSEFMRELQGKPGVAMQL